MRRQRRVDVFADEFLEMLRLMGGVNARAKPQQVARQLAKSRVALPLPLAQPGAGLRRRIGGLVHVMRKRLSRLDGRATRYRSSSGRSRGAPAIPRPHVGASLLSASATRSTARSAAWRAASCTSCSAPRGPRRREVQPGGGEKVLTIVDRGRTRLLEHTDRGMKIGNRGIDAALRRAAAGRDSDDRWPAGGEIVGSVSSGSVCSAARPASYERIASSRSPCRLNASPRLSQHAARPNA